jgi:hypothetical protein
MGNNFSMSFILLRIDDADVPTWVLMRISVNCLLIYPRQHDTPCQTCTARQNISHACPASVSHSNDSGYWLRFSSDCSCRWTLLLDRLISDANLRRLCLPLRAISVRSAQLVIRISCVVLFFLSSAYGTKFQR